MPSFEILDPEALFANLAHDLRQALSTVETSAFYLDLLLEHPQGPVQEQLRVIERQVAAASRMLADAAGEMRRQQAQRAGAGSLVLTNSATAGVT